MNFWDYKKNPQFKKKRIIKTEKRFLTVFIFFICIFCTDCKRKQKNVIIENKEITAAQKNLNGYLINNICSILNNKKIKNESDDFFYLKKIII